MGPRGEGSPIFRTTPALVAEMLLSCPILELRAAVGVRWATNNTQRRVPLRRARSIELLEPSGRRQDRLPLDLPRPGLAPKTGWCGRKTPLVTSAVGIMNGAASLMVSTFCELMALLTSSNIVTG